MRGLKTWAEPLEDTAESALAKALDAAEAARTAPPTAAPRIRRTPVSEPPDRPRRGGSGVGEEGGRFRSRCRA